MLCASAILLLLFEEFWGDISLEEKNRLAKIFQSCSHKLTETSDSVTNLMLWLRNKKFELSYKSRTAALWFNYTMEL